MAEDLPPPLSAKDKSSFAYVTIKDRLPVILSKVADTVYRKKGEIKETKGEAATEELKAIAGCVSKLRNEVQTNKPVIPLEDCRDDTEIWNKYLQEVTRQEGDSPKWFESPWLYVECYMYRRIQEGVEKCKELKDFDVFEESKNKTFIDSQEAILALLEYLHSAVDSLKQDRDANGKELIREFLQIALWGNKCDLSISAAHENAQTSSLLDQLQHLEANILVDDTNQVWQSLLKGQGHTSRVDIVLDNAGFELMTDLCLAEILMSAGLASQVNFHVKSFPWFVSDVTKKDFDWTIQTLMASNSIWMSKFGAKWQDYLGKGSWVIVEDKFWTTMYPFNEMFMKAPSLYYKLKSSNFIFFKGDLNYRKLVGDLTWKHTTAFDVSLRGFQPAPICALRACKSDTVVGLREGKAEEVETEDEKWMLNGKWAVISYADRLN